MSRECFFCNLEDGKKIINGKLAFVIKDDSPVTKHHSLVISKRHFQSFFDTTEEELIEINKLLKVRKKQISEQDPTVQGFNIGINVGLVAGQSIFHLHVHLIPRRKGDLDKPKGGVRGIIPEKRDY